MTDHQRPVEIDPELRRRLWARALDCLENRNTFWPSYCVSEHIQQNGLFSSDRHNCTRAQAEAFLAEVRRMGEMT